MKKTLQLILNFVPLFHLVYIALQCSIITIWPHSSFLHVSEESNKCISVVQNSSAVEVEILVGMNYCVKEPKYNFNRFVFHTVFFFFLLIWFADWWPMLLKLIVFYVVVYNLNFGSLFWRGCNKAYTGLQTTENWKEKAWKGAKEGTGKTFLVFRMKLLLVFLGEIKEAVSIRDTEVVKIWFLWMLSN